MTESDGGWLCGSDMTHLTAMTATHAADRLADWQTALRAENKSPGTIAVNVDGATRYLRGCAEHDGLPMGRAALNSWIAALLDTGAAPGTARNPTARRAPLRLPVHCRRRDRHDTFPGVKAPRAEPPLVESLTDGELRAASPPVRWLRPAHPPGTRCTTAATRPSSG